MGGCGIITGILLCPSALQAADLDNQLQIPIYNNNPGDVRNEADQFLRLGGFEERRGNLEKAIPFWETALQLYQQIPDYEGIGRTYDFLGLTYARLGRMIEAENALRRRLNIARTQRDFQGQIYGLNNVGTLLLQRGGAQEAAQSFREALTIARSIQDDAGQGLSLSNLGLAAAQIGDYYNAIKQYEQALIFRQRRGGDPIGEANTRVQLADAFFKVGQYRDAQSYYRSVFRLGQQTRDRTTQIRALDGLFKVYNRLDQSQLALEALNNRLILVREIASPQQELLTLQAYAQLYTKMNNRPLAKDYYQRAIRLARQLKDDQLEISLINQLGQVLVERK